MKIKSRVLSYFRWILMGVIVCFLAYNIYCHRKDLVSLRRIDILSLFMLAGLIVIFNYLGALSFSLSYHLMGAKVGMFESFALSIIATMANILLPGQAGGFVRAVYLKQIYKVPYSKVPAILLGNVVVTVFIGGLLMLSANIFAYFRGVTAPPVLWVLSTCAFGSIILFWMPLSIDRLPFCSERLLGIFRLFFSAWKEFSRNKSKLMAICILQMLSFFVSGACAWIAYRALGIHIGLTFAVVLMTATTLLSLVNIVPGNLGINETIIAYFSTLFGISFTYGLIVAVIMRTASYLITLLFAPAGWFFLFQKKHFNVFQYLSQHK